MGKNLVKEERASSAEFEICRTFVLDGNNSLFQLIPLSPKLSYKIRKIRKKVNFKALAKSVFFTF
jgi:hypothetical protein